MPNAGDHDPTGRFSNRADDYARYRPSYPTEAIDALLRGLGAPETLYAVDVGAGTGISSRLLAGRGVHVTAVEPNREMREAAAADPRVTFVDGTAETLPVADGGADLVLAAQAFHWFRAEPSVREMARALRAGGRLALMWNRRSVKDSFTAGYRDALLAIGANPTLEAMESDVGAVERSGLFGPTHVELVVHAQPLDRDALVGRALSASYVPKDGPALETLVAELDALFARHAGASGKVAMIYETEIRLSERLPR
ncbi:MAG TPA: class I SAM-dependent methyltransferase [Polyangiaceae bacterium]|nr:class I SAM-dependent methyltransferase [Polyangiaceae bacterium]